MASPDLGWLREKSNPPREKLIETVQVWCDDPFVHWQSGNEFAIAILDMHQRLQPTPSSPALLCIANTPLRPRARECDCPIESRLSNLV